MRKLDGKSHGLEKGRKWRILKAPPWWRHQLREEEDNTNGGLRG